MSVYEKIVGYKIRKITDISENKIEIILEDDRDFIIVFDAVVDNLKTYS